MDPPGLPTLDHHQCDPYIEHLQKKYLLDENKQAESLNKANNTTDFSPNEVVMCSPASSLTLSEKQHYQRAMTELRDLLRIGESKLEKSVTEYQSVINKSDDITKSDVLDQIVVGADSNSSGSQDGETTLTQSVTLPTLPSDYTTMLSDKARKSVRISTEPTTFLDSDFSSGFEGSWSRPGILRSTQVPVKFKATDIRVIHEELMHIHRKLNDKSRSLARWQEELEERRRDVDFRSEQLNEKEELIALNEASANRAHDVMLRLQGVEAKVQGKIQLLQESHTSEVNELNACLCERVKECKRLKKSFDVIKAQNDDLKTHETELCSENEKLRSQNQKLRKRLENLQRKQEFTSGRLATNQVLADHTNKQRTEEKSSSVVMEKQVDKSSKVWNNSLEALSVSLDWVSEVHLCRSNDSRVCDDLTMDRCLKVLPLLVEVLRHLPLCTSQPKHHLSFLRFIHWSLHHLEDAHHALLSSTSRRIGEELFKPSASRSIIDSSLLSSSGNKTLPYGAGGDVSSRVFFRSSNVEVRLLSSFIILRTLHQADTLAQVFEQLKKDLKDEESRRHFLTYSATFVVVPFLSYKSNKSLMSCAVDVMLHMAVESSLLPSFLEQCGCESWFRAISSAMRAAVQASDNSSMEKISIILQKLSKIKSNKKFFDSLSLGVALQEVHRGCDPDATFLSLNLRSILSNLNLIKS